MTRCVCIVALVAVSLLTREAPGGTDKSAFDVDPPGQITTGPLAKVAWGYPQGWVLSRERGEVSLLRDGCFTIGTSQGQSGTLLDSATTVTYGHPFARTSYVIFHVDGSWGTAEDFFVVDSGEVTIAGDSIMLRYRRDGLVEAQSVLALENSGSRLRLSIRLKNLDSISHTFGTGIALDPALGNRGDGVAKLGGALLLRDTVLSAAAFSGAALRIAERSTALEGMSISLNFPDSPPATTIMANWGELAGEDMPDFVPPVGRLLYDLVLNLFWSPEAVPPGASAGSAMEVELEPPDFGNSVFLRWDLPSFVVIDEGTMFPPSIASMVNLTNVTSVFRNASTLQVHVSGPVSCSLPHRNLMLGTSTRTYEGFPLTLGEVYEDQVVELSVAYREDGVLLDSLVRPMFIPATPVSDTGLVVRLDSILAGGFPAVTAIFTVEREATHQKVYNLRPENIFLFENAVRIEDFSLGKDTTGGLGNADIVFVLDVTGSMGDEIDAVKNNILEFTDSLSARGVDFQLGMVTFLDAIESVFEFTSDPVLFKQEVSAQYAHAGGDGPENSLDALWRATQFAFRPGANRIFIWITDADYHQNDWATQLVRQDVVTRLLSEDITVHAIGPTIYQTDWYNPIIGPTGGQFYDIYGNFRDILLDISRLQGISRYALHFQSPLSAPGPRELTVEVHYAGLGGSATASYTFPGGQMLQSLACYPNPFNPVLTIRLGSPMPGRAVIAIYNVLGQEIRLFEAQCGAGQSELLWDARDNHGAAIATGLYLVRVSLYSPENRVISTGLQKVLYLK